MKIISLEALTPSSEDPCVNASIMTTLRIANYWLLQPPECHAFPHIILIPTAFLSTVLPRPFKEVNTDGFASKVAGKL